MSETITQGSSPIHRPKRRALKAVLNVPEIAAMLEPIWDGKMIIEIEKVKGKLKGMSLNTRDDVIADDLIKSV